MGGTKDSTDTVQRSRSERLLPRLVLPRITRLARNALSRQTSEAQPPVEEALAKESLQSATSNEVAPSKRNVSPRRKIRVVPRYAPSLIPSVSSPPPCHHAPIAPSENPPEVPSKAPRVVVKLGSWMGHELVSPMRFWDVCLPGSHNSGSWCLSEEHRRRWNGVVFAFLKLYIHCQEKTVYQQLQLGVRFLDLRVCKNMSRGGEPYVAHGGFRTVALREVYTQIGSFLEEHPSEIVIVSVRRDIAYLTGPGSISVLESDFLMVACLKQYLGSKLEADTTIGQLAGRHQNVIYFFEEQERYLAKKKERRRRESLLVPSGISDSSSPDPSVHDDSGYLSDRSGITALPAAKAMGELLSSRSFQKEPRRERGYSDPDLSRILNKADTEASECTTDLPFLSEPMDLSTSSQLTVPTTATINETPLSTPRLSLSPIPSKEKLTTRRSMSWSHEDNTSAPLSEEILEESTLTHHETAAAWAIYRRQTLTFVANKEEEPDPMIGNAARKFTVVRDMHKEGQLIKRVHMGEDNFEVLTPFTRGRAHISKSWHVTCDADPQILCRKLVRWSKGSSREPFTLYIMAGEITPPSFDSPETPIDVLRFWTVQGASALVLRNRGLRSAAVQTHKLLLSHVLTSKSASRVNGVTHDFVSEVVVARIVKLNILAAIRKKREPSIP